MTFKTGLRVIILLSAPDVTIAEANCLCYVATQGMPHESPLFCHCLDLENKADDS